MGQGTGYVLGTDDAEVARLDAQARSIAAATDVLLRAAGIGGPMRVLDVGTGLGHVALRVAELLGPGGSVLGVDQAAALLAVAERRRAEAGATHVRFMEADVRSFATDEPFDAIVARLLLFHLPDRAEVVSRLRDALRPGGRMVVVEFDIAALRAEPETPLVNDVRGWIEAAFRSVGADPRIGARAAQLLRHAGYTDVATFGVQPYCAPDDPVGPLLGAGVTRSLAPQILAAGIADEAQLGLDTLRERLAAELAGHDAVLRLPTVVGAWGERPRDAPPI